MGDATCNGSSPCQVEAPLRPRSERASPVQRRPRRLVDIVCLDYRIHDVHTCNLVQTRGAHRQLAVYAENLGINIMGVAKDYAQHGPCREWELFVSADLGQNQLGIRWATSIQSTESRGRPRSRARVSSYMCWRAQARGWAVTQTEAPPKPSQKLVERKAPSGHPPGSSSWPSSAGPSSWPSAPLPSPCPAPSRPHSARCHADVAGPSNGVFSRVGSCVGGTGPL